MRAMSLVATQPKHTMTNGSNKGQKEKAKNIIERITYLTVFFLLLAFSATELFSFDAVWSDHFHCRSERALSQCACVDRNFTPNEEKQKLSKTKKKRRIEHFLVTYLKSLALCGTFSSNFSICCVLSALFLCANVNDPKRWDFFRFAFCTKHRNKWHNDIDFRCANRKTHKFHFS